MQGYFPFDFITTRKKDYNTVVKYEVINTCYYSYLYECIRLLKFLTVEDNKVILVETGEVIVDTFTSDDNLGEVMEAAIRELDSSFHKSLSTCGNSVINSPKGYKKSFVTLLDEYDNTHLVSCYEKESNGQKYLFGEFLFCEVIEQDVNEPARKPSKSRNNRTHTKKLLRQWLPKWKTLAVFDREAIVE